MDERKVTAAVDALLLPVLMHFGGRLDDAPEVDMVKKLAEAGVELPARLFVDLRDATEVD